MKRAWLRIVGVAAAGFALAAAPARAQFGGFTNRGLVGVGRLSANLFDAYGTNLDTLGGMFSGMTFDAASWSRSTNGGSPVYRGTLYCVPDRGYSPVPLVDFDYKLRLHTLTVEVTPYTGAAATNQTQIAFSNLATRLLLDDANTPFSSFNATDFTQTNYPRSATNSPGQGRRSLDPEGLARLRDGSFYICDEYGPLLYKFSSNAVLERTLRPPEAWIPKVGSAYPRTNDFSAITAPDSGRKNNRGIESIGVTPDERRLFALLQTPLVQDGGESNTSRYVRLLVFDIDTDSPQQDQLVAEYVYELTLNGNVSGTRQTVTSALLPLNSRQLLVIDRDQRGPNSGATNPFVYKRVVLVDTRGATDILGSGYDLELGAPGQLSFALNGLPADLHPVRRQDFVDLLNATELARFGLNLNAAAPDANTLAEKWEGLALVPLNDTNAPNDRLLLVGCDNDFLSANVYHDGILVGTNATTTDQMLLAYRVTLPTFGVEPRLAIASSGDVVQVTWPASYTDLVLQTSAQLANSNWIAAASNAAAYSTTATNELRFFRLVGP